jgi:PAS domain S-box-containing protein
VAEGVSYVGPAVPMKIRHLFSSLGFRIIVPLLVICLLGGIGLYLTVQRTFSRFTERQISRLMLDQSEDVYAICDGNRFGPTSAPLPPDATEQRIRKARTMGAIESYFRQKGLQGFIVYAGKRMPLNRELSPGLQDALANGPANGAVGLIMQGEKQYAVIQVTYAPWDWRIIMARERTAYKTVTESLRTLYLHITYVLILGVLGLLVALENAVRRPLKAIVGSLQRGSAPKKTGIAELDYLSGQLREAMQKREVLLATLEKTHFIYSHDVKGTFTYLSPSITAILGYLPEEFMNHYSTYLTDHPVNREVARRTTLSIQGLIQPPYEVEIYHKDGDRRWLEVTEVPVLDGSGKVVAVEGIARDITEQKRFRDEREKLVDDLRHALAEIRTLRGVIPICSSCKKIRDDEGAWQQLELYLYEHSEAQFSHGICPDCLEKMYPGFKDRERKDL